MSALRATRLVFVCLLFAFLAYLVLVSPPKATAKPDDLAVHDGTPSDRACEELGFTQRADNDDVGGGIHYQLAPSLSIAPPSPQVAGEPLQAAPYRAGTLSMKSGSHPLGSMLEEAPIDTERYPDATPNPIKTVGKDPVSTFSIDVDTASYSNVRRFLNDGQLPPRDAVRVEELVNYFDYGYARPDSATEPFRTHIAVTASPWAPGKEIVHIGLQGYEIASAERKPLNLVFLVDVSGSMNDPTKLPLAQKALNVLIDQLQPQDQVALAVYAGAAGAVLAPTPGNQKLKLRCAVDALRAGGSTAGGEGLALAYGMAEQAFDKTSVNRVILLTDGDFNVGIADPEKLEDFVAEKRKTGVYLSLYGFGRGNYNDVMMQTLAQAGNGTAAYVDTLQEARKLFHDDFSGSLFPIADDVKIQVEFNPARVTEYRLIGYETRLLNREDFNNDAVDAGEVGSGVSVTALYEITPIGGPIANDPLRYQDAVVPASNKNGELAYLKIRYKLPGEGTSRLTETPIGETNRVPDAAAAPEATRWALAVAAYGQKLRGDHYMSARYGWEQIHELAQGARGDDPFGIRAEFVQLVRAAETAKSVNE
jgi:Ca-activated chloride channel family protein